MLKKNRTALIAFGGLTAVALTLSGCSGESDESKDGEGCSSISASPVASSSTTSTTSASNSTAKAKAGTPTATVSTPTSYLSPIQAADIALKKAPGTAVKIEAECEDKTNVWEVVIRGANDAGKKFYIDRATGAIKSEKDEELSDAQKQTPKVDIRRAIDIALKAVPGALDEAKLDLDGSTLMWKTEIVNTSGDDFDVNIDASSGQILKVEKD